jgi:hypothetical protein
MNIYSTKTTFREQHKNSRDKQHLGNYNLWRITTFIPQKIEEHHRYSENENNNKTLELSIFALLDKYLSNGRQVSKFQLDFYYIYVDVGGKVSFYNQGLCVLFSFYEINSLFPTYFFVIMFILLPLICVTIGC